MLSQNLLYVHPKDLKNQKRQSSVGAALRKGRARRALVKTKMMVRLGKMARSQGADERLQAVVESAGQEEENDTVRRKNDQKVNSARGVTFAAVKTDADKRERNEPPSGLLKILAQNQMGGRLALSGCGRKIVQRRDHSVLHRTQKNFTCQTVYGV